MRTKFWENFTWNLWCLGTVIGIWPRFIEPNWLTTTKKSLPIKNLPDDLQGLKILHFSDLHLNSNSSQIVLKALLKRIKQLQPDLVVFTGDFVCYSKIHDEQYLLKFLQEITAPFGCYAVLGNHDYQEYVSVNNQGDYDVINSKISSLRKGWKRVFQNPPTLTKRISQAAQNVSTHTQLLAILQKTRFRTLHNENVVIKIKKSSLNICGIGEYTAGKCDPAKAFEKYEKSAPGIVLAHNPDAIPYLTNYPGDLILCGHTHGGQVNLPWLCKKFMLVENPQFKRGLIKLKEKWVYINRGIGSAMFFRWFSMPEVTMITLKQSKQ